MTTVDHRTSAVLENVPFVETTAGPVTLPPQPKPTYVRNPHRTTLNLSAAAMGLSVGGFIYAVVADTAAKLPAFLLAMALIVACAVQLARYTAAEKPLEVVK